VWRTTSPRRWVHCQLNLVAAVFFFFHDFSHPGSPCFNKARKTSHCFPHFPEIGIFSLSCTKRCVSGPGSIKAGWWACGTTGVEHRPAGCQSSVLHGLCFRGMRPISEDHLPTRCRTTRRFSCQSPGPNHGVGVWVVSGTSSFCFRRPRPRSCA